MFVIRCSAQIQLLLDFVAIAEEQRQTSKSKIKTTLKKCPCLLKSRNHYLHQPHCNYDTSRQSQDIDFQAIRRILISNPCHSNKSKPANNCISKIFQVLQDDDCPKSNFNEKISVREETYSQNSFHHGNVSGISTDSKSSQLSKLNNTDLHMCIKTSSTNEISTKNCVLKTFK